MSNELKKNGSIILLLEITLIFIYSTCTYLRLQYSFYAAAFGYLLIIVQAVLFGHTKGTHFFNSTFTIVFFLTLFVSVLCFIHGGTFIWVTLVASYLHIYFWTFAFNVLAENYSKKTVHWFCAANLLLFALWSIATIRAISINPLAARGLYGNSASEFDYKYYHSIGCGGYGFIYGLLFTSGSLVTELTKRKGLKNLIVLLPLIVLFFITIIKSSFTMALMVVGLYFLLNFFYPKNETNALRKILAIIIILVVLLISYRLLLIGLNTLGEMTEQKIFLEKYDRLSNSLETGDILSLSRLNYYNESLKSFRANVLWGSTTIGLDSQIFIHLAYAGMFGFCYVIFLHQAFNTMRRHLENSIVDIFEILVIFLNTFNTMTDMTSISIYFFLVPAILLYQFPKKAFPDYTENESVSY